MTISSMEISARNRRITGLRGMLVSLGADSLIFTLRLNEQEDNPGIVMEDWVGIDNRGQTVDFEALRLDHYYVKDLCFLVRDEYASVQGRWVWWLEADGVQRVIPHQTDPVGRTL